ncbi:hypothetical protein [Streptomyces prasinus]|uniref:hypothetical protein n=1 Tax=Streptomyces prasinus TaxID=67345 RepID=UPI0036768FE6
MPVNRKGPFREPRERPPGQAPGAGSDQEDRRRPAHGTWHLAGTSVLTTAYFHTGAEFEAELPASGLPDVTVHGGEGPAWSLLKASEQHSGESLVDSLMFTAAPAVARIAEELPGRLALPGDGPPPIRGAYGRVRAGRAAVRTRTAGESAVRAQ